ncbi:MAG: N-acetylmuramoyl-L-alanine amidase [Gemmatimonadetes bacterium]|nr:N-acetylmuramoyl-L-alanine amidase [Gemmatimonadota bacterium]
MAVPIDRSLRLPASQYVPGARRKSGIAIHHTVGGSARDTFELWRADGRAGRTPRLVGTAYIVDRDGTVFETFDPAAWAYQFGLAGWTPAARIRFEQRFIGIEIASEGALIEREGELYCFGSISPRTRKPRDDAFDSGGDYRGYRWFDRYEAAQLDSLGRLVDELCTRFSIPRRYPDRPFDYYGEVLAGFRGVIGHAMVRSDKTDPAPDPGLWTALEQLARLKPTAVTPHGAADQPAPLNHRDLLALFQENVRRLDRMATAAGSLVKALLMELERRGTYVQLTEPPAGARTIGYRMVQGDAAEVRAIARALGILPVRDDVLEVRHAA